LPGEFATEPGDFGRAVSPNFNMSRGKSMGIQKIRDEGQTLQVPTGKILGIVDSRAEFERLSHALTAAGFQAKALYGDDGVSLLERIDQVFFSDMEERVLNGTSKNRSRATRSSSSRRRPTNVTR
jgi:hypothetical protein